MRRAMKRIPKIEFPFRNEAAATVIGEKILFLTISPDDMHDDPTQHPGFGKFQTFGMRPAYTSEMSQRDAIEMLMNDPDCVPLFFSDHRSRCKWCVADLSSFQTALVTARLKDAEPEFYAINGVWIPDQCIRKSYTGQDGLSRREWMVKQAESACVTYTKWCNGDVYGYEAEVFGLRRGDDEEPLKARAYYNWAERLHEDSCRGIYGWEAAVDDLRFAVRKLLHEMNFSRRAISAAMKEAA
ncbi:MAG TPA: hypothetical protein VFW94_23655 [Candidatus Acidoferrales bacterium]|nr:hypothetical protein [Candidatus Acidoferrales bacterium]